MLSRRIALILALSIAVPSLAGCSNQPVIDSGSKSPGPANEANTNRAVEPGMEGAKDNADELRTLINLPYEPEDLIWKEYTAGKPGEKQGRRVLAVFQFTPDESRKLIEAASKVRSPVPVALSTEKWFPKELVTQSEIGGEDGIQATAYAANEFMQTPFSEGTISRVDNTDFFVLDLYAK